MLSDEEIKKIEITENNSMEEKITKSQAEEIFKQVFNDEIYRIEASFIVKFQDEIVKARDNINMILNGLGFKLSHEFKEKYKDKL